ncbi:MAG: hypothetical protein NXH99_24130 [Rhodobacteraceae bacterium]|nr:hypothetical protein [Paracoccaceae bacterium]
MSQIMLAGVARPGAGVAGLNKLHRNVLTDNEALSHKAVIRLLSGTAVAGCSVADRSTLHLSTGNKGFDVPRRFAVAALPALWCIDPAQADPNQRSREQESIAIDYTRNRTGPLVRIGGDNNEAKGEGG